MKLKTDYTYYHSEDDLKFVLELAKVGHVHLLSHQISLMCENSFNFKVYSETDPCKGLKLPDSWVIEFIGVQQAKEGGKPMLTITFGTK